MHTTKIVSTLEISQLISLLTMGKLNFKIKSQRYYVWEIEHVKDLVDTYINDYPLPSIAVTTLKDQEKYDILDGKQRMITTFAYILGEKLLKIVEFNVETEERINEIIQDIKSPNSDLDQFNELSLEKQQKILNFRIPIIILETRNKNDKEKLNSELFDRLNRRMVPLSGSTMFISGLSKFNQNSKLMDKLYYMIKHDIYKTMKNLKYSKREINNCKLVQDIRNFDMVARKYMDNKKVESIRFKTDLKKEEDDYLSGTNKDDNNKKAEEVTINFLKASEKVINTLAQSKLKWILYNGQKKLSARNLNFILLTILTNNINILENMNSSQEVENITKEIEEQIKNREEKGISTPEKAKRALELAKEKYKDENNQYL